MKKSAPLRGFVFYTQDYFGDVQVRLMPGYLRIVWVEAFFLMDQSPRRGVLLQKNGEPYSVTELATTMNVPVEHVIEAFDWVVRKEIAGIDPTTKVLICRRMVRERKRSEVNTRNGRKGGNPSLTGKNGIATESQRNSIENRSEIENGADCIIVGERDLSNSVIRNFNRSDKAKPDPDPDPDPCIHSSLLQDLSNLENKNPLDKEPPAEKLPAARPRDLAADVFAEKHFAFTSVPYAPEAGSFVQLARLRKITKTPARQLPSGWEAACENYFASPLGQYSLADLANPKRYAVFKNSPLDEFNKPVNHSGRNGSGYKSKSKTDRTVEAAQRLSAALDREAGDRDERGDQRPNPARVLPEAGDFEA